MEASSSSSASRAYVSQGYADEGSGFRKSRSESSSRLTGHVVWNRHANDSSSSGSKNSSERADESRRNMPPEDVLFMNDSSSCDSSNQNEPLGAIDMERSQSEQEVEVSQSQRNEALKSLPYDELVPLLPVCEEGNTSIGSLEHEFNACSPCAFMMRGRGCKQGIYCAYCHLKHGPEVKPYRPRHCKKQRIRFKNTLDQLKAEVEENPETFNADKTRFPASIERNTVRKEKMKAILKEHQLQTIALNAVNKYHEDKVAPNKFSL